MKRWLALALLAMAAAAVLPLSAGEGDRIVLYPAYGDGDTCIVEGRVIARRAHAEVGDDDGRLRNLRRNLGWLINDERKGVAVEVELGGHRLQTRSDREGYFRVDARLALLPGWHEVRARSAAGEGAGTLLVVSRENVLGLISDVDDTILVSEVTRKARLLANSLLANAAQREAVAGMAALYAQTLATNVDPSSAPLFYLSASPRQLHEPISDFVARNGFPAGVLITKRVTNDRSSEPLFDQFAYKIRHIEDILARLPWVRFILVGDDGERDPEVYEWLQRHYPERIAAVWIRRVAPGADDMPLHDAQQDLAALLGGVDMEPAP